MALPALRQPVVLDGYRGSGLGDPNKNYRLLVDLAKMQPKEGHSIYFSPSGDLRLLLRGAKVMKTRDGRITGETDPLEVKFEGGFLDTEDAEAVEILNAHKRRGSLFFSYDDVMAMQDEAVEKKLDEVLSAVSPAGMEKLKQKLDAKGFNLGKKSKA